MAIKESLPTEGNNTVYTSNEYTNMSQTNFNRTDIDT